MAHSQGKHKPKRKTTETVPEEIQTLGLLDKDLKSGVLNMHKMLKETMDEELRETRMMYEQIENINKKKLYKGTK